MSKRSPWAMATIPERPAQHRRPGADAPIRACAASYAPLIRRNRGKWAESCKQSCAFAEDWAACGNPCRSAAPISPHGKRRCPRRSRHGDRFQSSNDGVGARLAQTPIMQRNCHWGRSRTRNRKRSGHRSVGPRTFITGRPARDGPAFFPTNFASLERNRGGIFREARLGGEPEAVGAADAMQDTERCGSGLGGWFHTTPDTAGKATPPTFANAARARLPRVCVPVL